MGPPPVPVGGFGAPPPQQPALTPEQVEGLRRELEILSDEQLEGLYRQAPNPMVADVLNRRGYRY